MSGGRVLFYVQHLLGIGHQRRAATLTRAIEAEGLSVTFVSGGAPVPGLDIGGARLVQLPATRAVDKFFKVLVDETGAPVDTAWKDKRRDLLLDCFHRLRPHVLIFEMFPFGRRQLRFELLPLADAALAARPRPRIISSVRDILVAQKKPGRNDEMRALVRRYFDLVLVHGDAALAPFERTFPLAREIAAKIAYTGYVVAGREPAGGPGSPGHGEVIVSAGGGAVGDPLLWAALEAMPLTALADARWRFLVGSNVGKDTLVDLRAAAPANAVVEESRADFTTLLANCALSISQGGYNTVMEILAARARAVVVPYAGGLETEQTLRADLLAARSSLQVVPEATLSGDRLAIAIAAALDGPPASFEGFDTGGAAATARIVAAQAAMVDAP